MPKRDGYIPGVPCWVDTSQPDPEAATDFYGGLFGWEFENIAPPDAPAYFVGRIDGKDVAAIGEQEQQLDPPVWNTYVLVEDADEAAAKAVKAGGSVQLPPMDAGRAGRFAGIADAEGASFCVWQANEFRGGQLVNVPGTWNFSDLYTRDPKKAMEFYGRMFGWTADEVGDEGYAMIYRPGYGEHLAKSDPGLYERLEGFGAERSFADVVASLNRASDGPARWGITFAVADADASAERATELGGTVVTPPFDTEWTRTTILADPDGCVFTASQFTPPS
jgi:uncharacterized protein